MRVIEITKKANGAYRNQTADFIKPPFGCAVIPDNLETPNFPFGDATIEEVNGVKTVTKWTPGTLPEPEPAADPEPTTADLLNAFLGVTSYE